MAAIRAPEVETFGPPVPRGLMPAPRPGSGAAVRRLGALPMPSIEWNKDVERETAHLYERVQACLLYTSPSPRDCS